MVADGTVLLTYEWLLHKVFVTQFFILLVILQTSPLYRALTTAGMKPPSIDTYATTKAHGTKISDSSNAECDSNRNTSNSQLHIDAIICISIGFVRSTLFLFFILRKSRKTFIKPSPSHKFH